MALSAYIKKKVCPACGKDVEQSDKEGRERNYCNDACKMKYHRRLKSQCLWCKHDSTLPLKPWVGETTRCWACDAIMHYTHNPKTKKVEWLLTKNGKKNLGPAGNVTKSEHAKA